MKTNLRMKRPLAGAAMAAAIVMAAGCATWDGMSTADKGTAAGAVVGGAVGHSVGGGVLGTVGGAVVGGAVGREVGKRTDD
jgi:osmotically inducible lipoprotein OsmB